VGYDADAVRPPKQDPSRAAVRCEVGLSVLFSVLLRPDHARRSHASPGPVATWLALTSTT
jgi:hypothetical protein